MNEIDQIRWQQRFLVFAGVLGGVGVALAAIGAHAFADILVGKAELRFDTALRMHLIHAPALLALAAAMRLARPKWWLAACALMSVGSLVFCAGLYLAALGISETLLPIVPAGGSALILAWLVAAISFARGLEA